MPDGKFVRRVTNLSTSQRTGPDFSGIFSRYKVPFRVSSVSIVSSLEYQCLFESRECKASSSGTMFAEV